ncbi:universal stress protein [Rhodopirellula bahusiensis]|uniref:Universal stress protein n=1 Tax=Rhodopirellula bahusiensis TaxID=2014065 RepID=A0A2G1W4E5_9BACT|nr:universal stress protein [Rhodopirellula bahusiensis]PHQ33893.1 universal stress protein [Rhodopirellula bahusiensis]
MRILLAVDSSPHAHQAVEFASHLPLRKPVDFDLVSVVAPPMMVDTGSMSMPLDFGSFLEIETDRNREAISHLANDLESQDHVHSVHTHVPIGPPTSALLDVAEQSSADLIVLGAIGHSAIERVLLGSVSDYVATHADSSALVVRAPKEASVQLDLQKIMVALSGRPEDERMLSWLKELKLRPNVEIHLVRILDRFTFYRQDLREQASDIWNSQHEQAQAQILDFETKLQDLGLNTETHLVEADHVGEALVEYSRRHGCDLAVTGDSDSGLLTRVFLGSTSRYVLRHADCSVLIIRDKEDRAKAHRQIAEQSMAGT